MSHRSPSGQALAFLYVATIAATCAFILLWSSVADAQTGNCAPMGVIESGLESRFGEVAVIAAPAMEGAALMRVWHNADTDTWTVTLTRGTTTCMLVSGTGIVGLPRVEKKGDPS